MKSHIRQFIETYFGEDRALRYLDALELKLLEAIKKDNEPIPNPGRSAVNDELKRIWKLYDEGKEISPEDLKYISDYYNTQANFWNSKSAKKDEEASGQGSGYDLIKHLHRQRQFSKDTFGPGDRLLGVLDHIRRELREIQENPEDITEWIDLILLAFDGTWRRGFTPEEIATALEAKQSKNEKRNWPDWRTAPKDKAIEHIKISPPSTHQGGTNNQVNKKS